MIRFQRVAQGITFLLFVGLLYAAAYPTYEGLSVDFFLRPDPLIAVGTAVAERDSSSLLVPGFVVLVLAAFLGRLFCGHICPMGSTLDFLQATLIAKKRSRVATSTYHANAGYRGWKYLFLAGILGAGVAGVSLVHLGSPLSLVTRLYGLVIYPIVLRLGELAVGLAAPVGAWFPELAYVQLPHKVFATNVFVAGLFLGIFLLALLQPRFWCRNLCPAGALMAMFSGSPLLKRTVAESCNRCGRCIRECPVSAIPEDSFKTVHSECIVCLRCTEVCPQRAVSFAFATNVDRRLRTQPDPTRRGILLASVSGLFGAAVVRTNIHQPIQGATESVLTDAELIRPPGAVPEPEFLVRCIRCGECMKACPTNTLQPIWLRAGLEGLFTPVMVPRLAGCSGNCNACGKVCPTQAILDLPLIEKQHTKVGTAWIIRQNCLVWEQDKKCLVCDEVCPYNAVSFRPVPDLVNAAPFVVENRCTGCGWCENKCPVKGASAIRVNVIGEVRLASGSYIEKAKEYGFEFKARDNSADSLAPGTFEQVPEAGQPPAYRQAVPSETGLPPGFLPNKP